MILDMDDIKVVGANLVCMVMLRIQEINAELQAILFFATITYTIIRTINELRKLRDGKKHSGSSEES